MAFEFDATEGGASANSLCTVEFADDYFGGSLYASDWPAGSSGADLLNKQKALVSGTRDLVRLTWQGTKTSSGQALAFPRYGLYDKDDDLIDSSTNPREIKEANCELALFKLSLDQTSIVDESLRQFKRLKIASVIDLEMRDEKPSETGFPPQVMELIGHWLMTSGYSARLIRA